MKTSAFTIKSTNGISRVLQTEIAIFQSGTNVSMKIQGIWDTGATAMAITSRVVQSMGLVATGFAMVNTANGQVPQNTYSIDVVLPNGVKIAGLVATELPGLTDGCDALIGMDIITLGDFSITNHNNVTCMSLRIPSSHEIDYVASPDFGIVKVTPGNSQETVKQVKPNDKCSCGSGEKYKRCHGKR